MGRSLEKQRAYHQAHYAAHKEEYKERYRIYYAENRVKHNAATRAYYANHKKPLCASLPPAQQEELRASWRAYYDSHREHYAAYRAANLEKSRAYARAFAATHGEQRRAYGKIYQVTHKEQIKASREIHKTQIQGRHRKRLYQLSPEAFDSLFQSQGGTCAACRGTRWGNHGPHIDHDHATGRVRGILCHYCNAALGMMNDNVETARALIAYLLLHQPTEANAPAPQD